MIYARNDSSLAIRMHARQIRTNLDYGIIANILKGIELERLLIVGSLWSPNSMHTRVWRMRAGKRLDSSNKSLQSIS